MAVRPTDDGEMAGRIRSHGWAETPLGPIAGWPRSLGSATRLMLGCRHPMSIWWGPELVQLYNDAFREVAGPDRHPSALGRPGRDTWADIWPAVGPQVQQVMCGGPATWHEDQPVPVAPRGDRPAAWWTYGISPIDDDAAPNGVGGVLVLCRDVTRDHLARAAADREAASRDGDERFRQFAAASSDVLWIRNAGTLAIEYVSPAARAVYGVDADALLGDPGPGLDLVLPDDRPGVLARIERVRRGEAVLHDYRVRRPSDGRQSWIRSTGFPLRDERGRVGRIGGIAQDVTEQKATEAALIHSEQRLRTLVEGVPQLVWRAVDGGHWTWASPQWTAFTGQREPDSHHLGWLEPIHPDDRDRAEAAWNQAMKVGGFEVDYRIRRASDGAYRWFQTRATPVRGPTGEIMEWLGTSTDVDDLRRLQDSQAVMVAELQHRTRNLIAVVRGVADDTMEHTGPTEAFRDAFFDRLTALSRVQGLLSRSEAEPITIAALVELELEALGTDALDRRVAAFGPEVFLKPSTVQTLALALHELATNARKHGALSHERGRLAVTWRERDDGAGDRRLTLDWVETGLDQTPERAKWTDGTGGYGRELIERALPHALGARTRYELTSSGVRCVIDIPARSGPRGEATA